MPFRSIFIAVVIGSSLILAALLPAVKNAGSKSGEATHALSYQVGWRPPKWVVPGEVAEDIRISDFAVVPYGSGCPLFRRRDIVKPDFPNGHHPFLAGIQG